MKMRPRYRHTRSAINSLVFRGGMSLRQISRLTCIPPSSLSELAAGNRRLTNDIIDRLSKIQSSDAICVLKWAWLLDEAEQFGLIGGAA